MHIRVIKAYYTIYTLKNSKKCLVNYAPTLQTGSQNDHKKGYFDCKMGCNFDHEF